MPAYNLSVAEIAFLLEKVDKLKLQAVQTGSVSKILTFYLYTCLDIVCIVLRVQLK